MPHRLTLWWFKLAGLYFAAGVCLGVYMGASHDHTLFPVHAHINLLGWVSLTLIGLLYQRFPHLAATRLAQVQFWLYNLTLPVLMGLLAGLLRGHTALEPLVGLGSVVMAASVLLFVINLFRYLDRAPAPV